MLQWIEAIDSAKTLDPSPILLQTTDGPVTQAGFVNCQEFAKELNKKGANPLQPIVRHKLTISTGHSGAQAAVDYGKHWAVLRSSGLVQCLVRGRPETLFNLSETASIKVHNPREMREGVDYFIEVETSESRFVLKAELPTDHYDWVLAIEQNLKGQKREKILHDHRKRESGYVAFKRLLMLQGKSGSSQLYCLPRAFDDMEDIYEPLVRRNSAPLPPREPKQSELLHPRPSIDETKNLVPLPPRDYLPPPLPPRDHNAPPIPPKGTSPSLSSSVISIPGSGRPVSIASTVSGHSDPDDDYVLMQSPSGAHILTSRLGNSVSRQSPSQPITIPNRRPSKRSVLLRGDSESSSHASSPPTPLGTSLSDLQEGSEWSLSGRSRQHSITNSTHSLNRQNSSQSLSSASYGRQYSVPNALSTPPPLPPPRTSDERSSGYCSPLLGLSPSPNLQRSQSHRIQNGSQRTLLAYSSNSRPDTLPRPGTETVSHSDGMVVSEAKQQFGHMITRSFDSNGYSSSNSSSEDISQVCESITSVHSGILSCLTLYV